MDQSLSMALTLTLKELGTSDEAPLTIIQSLKESETSNPVSLDQEFLQSFAPTNKKISEELIGE